MQQPSLAFALNGRRVPESLEMFADSRTPHSTAHSQARTPHSNAVTPHSRRSASAASGMFVSAAPSPKTPLWGDRGTGAQFAQLQPNLAMRPDVVSVIAPGGGTGINGAVYAELGRNPRFQVEIVGQSRAHYDIYPEDWPEGRRAPNLASFAQDVLNQGVLEHSDCLVCGSRGGQVVLPHFWAQRGDDVPPAVVINGGVAMGLPTPVQWPEDAITFLLIGGQDNFRGHFTPDEYVADTHRRVPITNSTTAILYVNEMMHMPQGQLLNAVLPLMLRVLLLWKADRVDAILEVMRHILQALSKDGWSGRLLFTKAAGMWEDLEFSPFHVDRLQAPPPVDTAPPVCSNDEVIQHTQHDDMRALWKYAASAVRRGGEAPLRHDGSRMAAVAQAAKAKAERDAHARQDQFTPEMAQMRQALFLPMPRAGYRGDGGGRADLPVEPTPISRALGITRAPHGSPVSCESHSSGGMFFPEPSPKRLIHT